MKTNEELGAVYLEVEGLDKERFKELTKGMEFYGDDVDSELSDGCDYIENWLRGSTQEFEWISTNCSCKKSKLITLDELEQLLYPMKPTHFAISPEEYEEWQAFKNRKKIEIHGCLMDDCEDLNYDRAGVLSDYTNFELISLDYGDRDVFKARRNGEDEDIILFGKWNDGVQV